MNEKRELATEGVDGADHRSDVRSIRGGDDHAGGEEEDELNAAEAQH